MVFQYDNLILSDGSDYAGSVGGSDKLNLRENALQCLNDVPLPRRMQVQIDLINQNDALRLGGYPIQKLRVQQSHTVGDVRDHTQHVSVTVAHLSERMNLYVTVGRPVSNLDFMRLHIIAALNGVTGDFRIAGMVKAGDDRVFDCLQFRDRLLILKLLVSHLLQPLLAH